MEGNNGGNGSTLLQDAICWITGARGVGKSMFAWAYYDPLPELLARVFGHDAEKSANRIVQQVREQGLDFGCYRDLGKRFSDLPSEDDLLHRLNTGKLPWVDGKEKGALRGYYEYVIADLDENLKQGAYDVYVHDPIEPFEGGMAAWCEDNIKLFGYRTIKQSMQHGRFWSDVMYRTYRQFFSSVFNRGVRVINLVSHLKNPWQDNRPVPGKVAPGGKPLLYLLSSLVIWLVNEPTNLDGAPAGLVLKERLGKLGIVNGKWEPRRMIPQRIPHCTWDDIKRYLVEGCDLSDPALQMKPAEKQMISELLTNEQLKLMILSAEERLKNGGGDEDGYAETQTVSTEVSFAVPAPEYLRAQERAKSLLANGQPITKESLLKAFAPPMHGKPAVQEAVGRALKESL